MRLLKIIFIINVLLICNVSFSQDSFENERLISAENLHLSNNLTQNKGGKFFDKFSLGIKGGINFSLIIPFERQTIFSGQNPEDYEKDYEEFLKNIGMQFGFIFMYDITKLIKISLQPALYDYVYKYKTTYSWFGKTELEYESEFAHSVRFFELPLIVGLYTTYNSWQPYFQGGAFYSRLLDAHSKINVTETSSNLSSSQELNYETAAHTVGLYKKHHYGLLAGAGISYLTGNMRIGLEANYRVLLSNLNTTETQYMNNQIVSGNYDVPDKFKFSNLEVSLCLIMTMSSGKTAGRGSSGSGAVPCPSF